MPHKPTWRICIGEYQTHSAIQEQKHLNADETILYLLNGSKVYEVDLTQANPPQPPEPAVEEEAEEIEEIVEVDETTDVIETEGTADQS